MGAPGRFAVLLNARARGWSGEIHQAVLRYVAPHDLILTDNLIEARRGVRRALEADYDSIFVGGGDGTIVFLLNELEERAISQGVARADLPPVGVLRLGTGNALAEYLGAGPIVDDLSAAKSGAPLALRELSLIEGPDGLFPFAGFGWDADILSDYEMVRQLARGTPLENHISGMAGYAAAIVTRTAPRAARAKSKQLRITNTGRRAARVDFAGRQLETYEPGEVMFEGEARICGASSIPYWGFRVRMFPHADREPARFQMRVFHGGVLDVLRRLPSFWKGALPERMMFDALVESVRVESLDGPIPYQVSGDVIGEREEITWALARSPLRVGSVRPAHAVKGDRP